MRKKLLFLFVVWLMVLACQVIPTPPPLTPTPVRRDTAPTSNVPEIQGTDPLGQSTADPTNSISPAFELTPLELLPEKLFSDTSLEQWQLTGNSVSSLELPVDLDQVVNIEVIAGLTNAQKRYLAQNGFVALQNLEGDFSTIRHKVSTQYGQPYFLTTDAAGYALKSTTDALLIALEREEFARILSRVVQSTLEELQGYLPGLQGSVLEKDARLAVVYLSVGLYLLDPSTQFTIEPDLETLFRAQVAQVLNTTGTANLLIMPGVQLDFSDFIIPEFYRGDQVLEAYHRGRTWFEQVGFSLVDRPGIQASRTPLLISLALRRASIEGQPSAQLWANLDEAMAFFYGRSQDDDPRRYAQIMDRVYGNRISVLAFEDEDSWQVFRVLAQTLPADSAYLALERFLRDQPGNRDWRFLGRRFFLDKAVLSVLPLIRDDLPDLPHYTTSGLDWMAAAGSQQAEAILEAYLVMQADPYAALLSDIQDAVKMQSQEQWQATFWGAWNFAFLPSIEPPADDHPPFMRQPDWMRKGLISALGLWALSHHRAGEIPIDPASIVTNDQIRSNPAPAYVQPIPDVYYRLSFLANVIVDGLNQRQMTGQYENQGMVVRLQELRDLGDRLARLGDISVKEIHGLPLEPNDFALIQAPLGPVDLLNTYSLSQSPNETQSVMAITVAAEKADHVLHAGIGKLDWLYVVVPIDGKFYIAQGGNFSYYEFNQPIGEILDDEDWRWIVLYAQPDRPAWAMSEQLSGGSPYFVLAFRKDDIYRITPAGANLSVRSDPSRTVSTLQRLRAGDVIQLIDGPVEAEGSTWWQIAILDDSKNFSVVGWVIQNQDWFERVYDR